MTQLAPRTKLETQGRLFVQLAHWIVEVDRLASARFNCFTPPLQVGDRLVMFYDRSPDLQPGPYMGQQYLCDGPAGEDRAWRLGPPPLRELLVYAHVCDTCGRLTPWNAVVGASDVGFHRRVFCVTPRGDTPITIRVIAVSPSFRAYGAKALY